ncbi:MAG: hypothetical protein II858_05800 [Bacteroidales bacterium]|nr:hypothetical protein [Bacteroidales bacterium]
MDTEKTPPVEEKGRTLTVDDIVKALRENGITPISVDTDGPECVDFAYQDNYYIIKLLSPPFITITQPNLLDSEGDDVERMKDAALYVSSRTCGPCVLVLPNDYMWVVNYDYLVDSYNCLKKHLLYILDTMFDAGLYFFEYYLKLQSKSDEPDPRDSKEAISEEEALLKYYDFPNIPIEDRFHESSSD